jgi:hypothetical protein
MGCANDGEWTGTRLGRRSRGGSVTISGGSLIASDRGERDLSRRLDRTASECARTVGGGRLRATLCRIPLDATRAGPCDQWAARPEAALGRGPPG